MWWYAVRHRARKAELSERWICRGRVRVNRTDALHLAWKQLKQSVGARQAKKIRRKYKVAT
jgi:hypothetical protein